MVYHVKYPQNVDLTEVMRLRTNIEAERGRLQMTKTEMCKQLGVTMKTYNGYIRGQAIPSNILEKLRKMTGQPIDYLLGLPLEYPADKDAS